MFIFCILYVSFNAKHRSSTVYYKRFHIVYSCIRDTEMLYFLKQQSHATCLLFSTNQSRFGGSVGKGYASLAEGCMFEFKSRHT